jgi:hypothetical protein
MHLLVVFRIMNHQCTVVNHSKKTCWLSHLLHLSNRPLLYKTCKTFNYWQELRSGILTDTILQEIHLCSIKKRGVLPPNTCGKCVRQVVRLWGNLTCHPHAQKGMVLNNWGGGVNSLCEWEQTIARRSGMPLPYTGIWVMQCRNVSKQKCTANRKRNRLLGGEPQSSSDGISSPVIVIQNLKA